MNTRDLTTMSDDELRAEADALTRECLAAWHRKRDADLAWAALSERKADVTLELARRYNGVKQGVRAHSTRRTTPTPNSRCWTRACRN